MEAPFTAARVQATMAAALKYEKGQASVELKYEMMEPAVLFGGDISAYVLWAVTSDGLTENLGEVQVDEKEFSASRKYSSGKKIFALMVTAEPLAVMNPYAAALTFPAELTRTRRDHEKYLTLMDAIALLHQHQRPIKTATRDDAVIRYVESSCPARSILMPIGAVGKRHFMEKDYVLLEDFAASTTAGCISDTNSHRRLPSRAKAITFSSAQPAAWAGSGFSSSRKRWRSPPTSWSRFGVWSPRACTAGPPRWPRS